MNKGGIHGFTNIVGLFHVSSVYETRMTLYDCHYLEESKIQIPGAS
jgi:hypothetical protein